PAHRGHPDRRPARAAEGHADRRLRARRAGRRRLPAVRRPSPNLERRPKAAAHAPRPFAFSGYRIRPDARYISPRRASDRGTAMTVSTARRLLVLAAVLSAGLLSTARALAADALLTGDKLSLRPRGLSLVSR